ncbi:MAG TPA: hypothetical protein VII58_09615, partial [Acidobacteriaceae bacterium]
ERVARFVERVLPSSQNRDAAHPAPTEEKRRELEAEARRRMAQQIDDEWKAAHSDFVLVNDGSVEELRAQVDALWRELKEVAQKCN